MPHGTFVRIVLEMRQVDLVPSPIFLTDCMHACPLALAEL